MTDEPRQLAIVRSYPELLQAIRNRVEELNISRATLDDISGVQSGYSAKVLVGRRGLGPVSLSALLGALGAALVLVEDVEALAKVRSRLEPRKCGGAPLGPAHWRNRRRQQAKPPPPEPASAA